MPENSWQLQNRLPVSKQDQTEVIKLLETNYFVRCIAAFEFWLASRGCRIGLKWTATTWYVYVCTVYCSTVYNILYCISICVLYSSTVAVACVSDFEF